VFELLEVKLRTGHFGEKDRVIAPDDAVRPNAVSSALEHVQPAFKCRKLRFEIARIGEDGVGEVIEKPS